jgi:hypothetical protein
MKFLQEKKTHLRSTWPRSPATTATQIQVFSLLGEKTASQIPDK